jgi:hypothetical protein
MLTRDGQFLRHKVPGASGRLTDPELKSYNAAFAAIEKDYQQIETVRQQLDRLDEANWEKSDSKPYDTVNTPGGSKWNVHASLLNLAKSDVMLCQKPEGGEWAVIQRLNNSGRYADTHGNTSVLLTGNNPRELVNEYSGQAEHTLRFMARNLTAKAQEVVWGQYADNNPGRVMRAISQRCALAVDNPDALRERQTIERGMKQSRGISI